MKKIPFLNGLSQSDLNQIISLFHEKSYKKKGMPIFFEGDAGNHFYIIKEGKVKVYRFEEVKEIILAILKEGSYFGEMAVIQENQVRSACVETMEPTTLYVLSRADLIRLLEENPKLTLNILQIALERLRKTNEIIKDLTTLDARSRIFKTILRLAEDYGVTKENGLFINIKLTHQQIADMSGSVRETVTKALLELQDKEIISMEKKYILIKKMSLLKQKINY